MSEQTHTPGPWRVATGDKSSADGAAESLTTVIETDDTHIAFVFEDQPANARLIAAAPDLLEACRTAATLLRTLVAMNRIPENNAALRECLAAITKAEEKE